MAEIVENHEELEIDLLRQGVDLLDFWRGNITPRRLRLFMRNLPPDGLTVAKVDPETAVSAQWSATEHLLADLWDLTYSAHAENPQPHPRPVETWRRLERDRAVAAFLQQQAERNRQRDLAEKRGVVGGSS